MAPDASLLTRLKQTRPFATLHEEAVVALLVTADLMQRAMGQVVATAGLTLQQYNVLRILRGAAKDGLPTLEVAARMIEQAPGVTRLLDRLEAKGLVRRARCHRDRRQVLCWIEPAGLALLARLDQPVERAAGEITRGLDPEALAHLVTELARLRGPIVASAAEPAVAGGLAATPLARGGCRERSSPPVPGVQPGPTPRNRVRSTRRP